MTPPPVNDDIAVLRAALFLTAIPSHCAQLRKEPLPSGVGLLLRIVAADVEAIEFCAACLEKSPAEIREAAAFYLEQILLAPDADSYRVLAAKKDTPAATLRHNLTLLCRWLHSDICEDLARSVFFLRVTQAWNDLKTPARRAAYDAALAIGAASKTGSRAMRADGNGLRRSDPVQARQRKPDKKAGNERMIDYRKSRPKGLWRFMLFGRRWRAH
jgi:hypothetical protein